MQNLTNLYRDLDQARELIRSYELLIVEIQNKNDLTLKTLTHDLTNPLQILSMTIESLQDSPPKDISKTLERMKKSTDRMTEIIFDIRKMILAKNEQQQKSTQII